MTKKELEIKSKEYANKTEFTEYDNPSLSESLDISDVIQQAYIAGAEENNTVWHKITDGDLPKDKKEYWCKVFFYESEETFNAFLWFDPSTKEFMFFENIGKDEESGFKVKEWCEIPEE